jgi:hypothetical protein
MQDNDKPQATFTPTKPEQKVNMEVTAREAHLIKELRKCNFGKVIVFKANGILVRLETSESVLLNENVV